jgi:hypothetical protein
VSEFDTDAHFQKLKAQCDEHYKKSFRSYPLTGSDYDEMHEGIRKGFSAFSIIGTDPDTGLVTWRCFIRGIQVMVSYDRDTRRIVGVLPPKAHKKNFAARPTHVGVEYRPSNRARFVAP